MTADITLIIPTFNRKSLLLNLLNNLFNSPLAMSDIIVLDNCSTDGTSSEIQNLISTHPHLSYRCNAYNMGLAGNLVKAMELAYTCKTKYFWILFDDTKLDFTYWNEIEFYLQQNKPIVLTTNYYQATPEDLAPIFLMLIYPFAAIYRTELLTPVILLKALTDIYTIHPQMAFLCELFNQKTPFVLPAHNIALPAANPEQDYSFNRVSKFTHFRLSRPNWFIPGFLNAIEGLQNPVKRKCIDLLFHPYHGLGPYITTGGTPPFSAWHKVVLFNTLAMLPLKYKIKMLTKIIKSSWRKHV